MLVVQRIACQAQIEAADIVIRPRVGHIRWDEMARADELLAAGREAALESMDEIRGPDGSGDEVPTEMVPIAPWTRILTKRPQTYVVRKLILPSVSRVNYDRWLIARPLVFGVSIVVHYCPRFPPTFPQSESSLKKPLAIKSYIRIHKLRLD